MDPRIEQLKRMLAKVSYKYDLKFSVMERDPADVFFHIRVMANVECAYARDGNTKMELLADQQFFKSSLPEILADFNNLVRRIIAGIEQHEIDEWLLINGERVFDPHKNELEK